MGVPGLRRARTSTSPGCLTATAPTVVAGTKRVSGARAAARALDGGDWGTAALALALGLVLLVEPAEAVSKPYESRQEVPVIANNVFPWNNPAETYRYYSLPFCEGDSGKPEKARQRFGELLVGDRKMFTNYKLYFRQDTQWAVLCDKMLQPDELKDFADAIKDDYRYELFIDDLPVMGAIGKEEGGEYPTFSNILNTKSSKVYLYPHISFTIGFNEDRIVSVQTTNVETSDTGQASGPSVVDITDASQPKRVQWTYSVQWVHKETPHSERMALLAGTGLLPRHFEIHWLSIINSFVLVLILTVFLGIILVRGVKNDFTRYMDVDEDEFGEEESGWKLIHGDVFRFPSHVNMFAAFAGAGAQLCVVTLLVLVCALLGVFSVTKRGSVLTCLLVLYSLTSWVSGLMSARLYRQLGGKNWVWNSITASLVFPGPLLIVFSIVNTIALVQLSTAAIPFYPVMVMVAMFVFIVFPLTVIGAIVGRNTASDFQAPCRTTRVPRQVPKDIPWYTRHASQMFMSGFLPFSAIYIELHYIFASVWGHQIYTMFGILILAFILLLVVCSFITVALIYFQLVREDHQWWWRSFLSGGSTGLFVYAYSFFFFFRRSQMHGLLQSSMFFGYMAVISYAFFIMLGFVGFASSLKFVKHIYSVVKCD